jgi:hypothetical protein
MDLMEMNRFFSLSGPILSILAISGLLLLMIYSGIKGDRVYQKQLSQFTEPSPVTDKTFCLSYLKIEHIEGERVHARDRRNNLFILQYDKSQKLDIGGTYSLSGIVNSPGELIIKEIQHHRHRILKYVFSSLSFIVVIALLIKYFRIDKNGIYLIQTDNP